MTYTSPGKEHVESQTDIKQPKSASGASSGAINDSRDCAMDARALQARMAGSPVQQKLNDTAQRMAQTTNAANGGLPGQLKAGIENLSGISMDGVAVHYNSSQPAQLNAHAFAQGRDIHVAPGQEKHLAHEAWHVVQQAQGRVRPTTQLKDGAALNDDDALEREADQMGEQAQRAAAAPAASPDAAASGAPGAPTQLQAAGVVQRFRVVRTDGDRQEVEFKRTEAKPVNGLHNGTPYLYEELGSAGAQAVLYSRIHVSNFTGGMIQGLSRAQLDVFFPYFSALQVAMVGAQQIAGLDPNCIANLTQAQAAAVTAVQAAALTQAQFGQLPAMRIPDLGHAAFAALSPGSCIANLSQAQAAAITAGQAGAMTQAQFAQLAAARIPDLGNAEFAALSPGSCIANLSQAQAAAITAGQAGAMTQAQFAQLAAARIPDLGNAEFAALSPGTCIANLSQAQAAAITAGQAGAMTQAQFAQLAAARIPDLGNAEFAALSPGNCIANLTQAQTAAITANQAGVITQLQFAQVAAARIPDLTNQAFAALSPANCIAHLTQAQTAAITANQAGVITQLQFAQVAAARIPDLTNQAFAALSPVNCIANLTQPQAAAITVGQAGVMTQLQFAQLTPARIPALTTAAFAALSAPNCIAHLTPAQAAAITGGQAVVMTYNQIYDGIAHLQHMGATSRRLNRLNLRDAVRAYIYANGGAAPPGFVGGAPWNNYRGTPYTNIRYPNNPLPGGWGMYSPYSEYDVYPYVGLNRGDWRIVSDGATDYYTDDHYYSFTAF